METPRAMPASIADSVLKGRGHAPAAK